MNEEIKDALSGGWKDEKQPHTVYGKRGQQLVEGLTMKDIHDCYVQGFLDATGRNWLVDSGSWSEEDVYNPPPKGFEDFDPIAVAQNMGIRIEKKMGIYPNVPRKELE